MGSKLRQTRDRQMATFEKSLQARMALLISRGIEQGGIERDTQIRKWRAAIGAVKRRIAAIDANEKKTTELAAAKAARAIEAAGLRKTAMKEEPAQAVPKEKKEKKAKEAPAEGTEKKEKKKKAEKTEKAE